MAQDINKIKSKRIGFQQILICSIGLRFVFYFYSFISFIFWILNCLAVEWLYIFNPLFKFPILFIRKILNYYPQGANIDFSLAIIGVITLILGYCLHLFAEKVQIKAYELQEEEQKLIFNRRQKNKQNNFINNNKMPEVDISIKKPIKQQIQHEAEPPKLVLLLAPQVSKMNRRQNDTDLTFQEVQEWKQRITKKLLESLQYSKPSQKGFYRKNLFLLYNDFFYINELIQHIKPTLAPIIKEYEKYGITIKFCIVLSVLSSSSASIEKELDLMDIILSLNFYNKVMLTQRFKLTYENMNKQPYNMKFKGEYNLSKNLTITNNQPLYVLEDQNNEGGIL